MAAGAEGVGWPQLLAHGTLRGGLPFRVLKGWAALPLTARNLTSFLAPLSRRIQSTYFPSPPCHFFTQFPHP